MRRRFKAKKRKNISKKIIMILLLLFIGIVIYFTFYGIKKIFSLKIIDYLLSDNKSIEMYQKDSKEYFDGLTGLLSRMNINQPISLLEKEFYFENKKEVKKTVFYFQKNQKKENNKNKPFVYIYNTHESEGYDAGSFKNLNVTTNVHTASLELKEKLEKMNITVLVEERRMSDYLKQNNLDYGKSYYASRFYLKDTLNKYNPNLIIDFHRDALSKNLSTASFNNKSYAKIMFVIGKASSNYIKIKQNSEKMNNIIKNKYSSLTRGVFERDGAYYNQDINENMILLEVGGQENTYDEVLNTVDILSEVIKEYVGG